MNRAERRRAKVKEPVHQDGSPAAMPRCPVAGCNNFVHADSELGLCSECDRIGRVVNYGVTQILLQLGVIRKKDEPLPEKKPSGPFILVPKPGLEKAAIEEAAAAEAAAKRVEEQAKRGERP